MNVSNNPFNIFIVYGKSEKLFFGGGPFGTPPCLSYLTCDPSDTPAFPWFDVLQETLNRKD